MSDTKFDKNEKIICFIKDKGHAYCEDCETYFCSLTWNNKFGFTSLLKLRCIGCGNILRKFGVCEITDSDFTIKDFKNKHCTEL